MNKKKCINCKNKHINLEGKIVCDINNVPVSSSERDNCIYHEDLKDE